MNSFVAQKFKYFYSKELVRLIFWFCIALLLSFTIYKRLTSNIHDINATDVAGDISTNTTWTLASSPYNLTNNVNIISGAVLTIEAGVEVRSNGNYSINVTNGTLDANGTSGNTIKFIHNTLTAKDSWGGIYVTASGTLNLDFCEVRYTDIGVRIKEGVGIINDTLFDTNHAGISAYNNANITTARNTFTNNTYTPIVIEPEIGTVSLGTGTDADIISTGNGYNGIGIAYPGGDGADTTTACLSDTCTIPQRTFGGISNIPYVIITNYTFSGSNDTLIVDGGVKVKAMSGNRFTIASGATIDINGTTGNKVYYTSYRDDSIGGDTNNDGITVGDEGDWYGIVLSSGTHTMDYANVTYADVGVYVKTSSLTVNDSTFESNRVGISAYTNGSITTKRNTFKDNYYTPIAIEPEIGTVSLGTGTDADIISTGNGYNGIGIAYPGGDGADTTTACLSDTCTIPQRTFGGISNIPYLIITSYQINGSDDTLVMDPGVIIKASSSRELQIFNGSRLDINGTLGNRVYLTSYKDDSIGGDTNNDGSTNGSAGDWVGIELRGANAHVIEFAYISYASYGIYNNNASNVTINDCDIQYNTYGYYHRLGSVSPVFARTNLEHNASWAMYNYVSTTINAENLWWGDSTGPYDNDDAGACLSNLGSGDPVRDISGYPIDYCPFSTTKFNANILPIASNVNIDSSASSINLVEGSTKTVNCYGLVTDDDGYTDIQSVTAILYRTGVGQGASDDDNNHYTLTGNTECVPSNGSGTTEEYDCDFSVYFHADPTDTGSIYETDNWTCVMIPTDGVGDGTSDSDTIEINTLYGINITDSIDFGVLNDGENSGSTNDIIDVYNTGNISSDLTLSGSNLCTDYPTCSAYTISVGNQEYYLSAFTYGSGIDLTSSAVDVDISISKPTASPSNSFKSIYWGIGVPGGSYPGVYDGIIIVSTKADT